MIIPPMKQNQFKIEKVIKYEKSLNVSIEPKGN